MPIRKSPTLTPKFLAANRANAAKSTGPRTARGKAFSSLNRMKDGSRSAAYWRFLNRLVAFPGHVDMLADALLTPQQRNNPAFASLIARWPRWDPGRAAWLRGKRLTPQNLISIEAVMSLIMNKD